MPRRSNKDTTFRWLREACQLTQQEFANLIGCSEITIRNLEAGRQRLSDGLATRLTRETGVMIRYDKDDKPELLLKTLTGKPYTNESYKKWATNRTNVKRFEFVFTDLSDLVLKAAASKGNVDDVIYHLAVALIETVAATNLGPEMAKIMRMDYPHEGLDPNKPLEKLVEKWPDHMLLSEQWAALMLPVDKLTKPLREYSEKHKGDEDRPYEDITVELLKIIREISNNSE